MDSTPSKLLNRHKGFGNVGILGNEESGEMECELLCVEDMWRDFGKICNQKVTMQNEHHGIGDVQ